MQFFLSSYILNIYQWSVGCILHELCTLKHTFTSNNLLGLVFQIMQAKPPPISPEYGEDVQSLLNKLLNKDKAARPSAVAVLQDACLKEAAKFIVDNLVSTGTLGTGVEMVLPPSPPPTPKKPGRPGKGSRSKLSSERRVSNVVQKPSRKQDDSHGMVGEGLPSREATDSPQINVLGKSMSTKKRQERKNNC